MTRVFFLFAVLSATTASAEFKVQVVNSGTPQAITPVVATPVAPVVQSPTSPTATPATATATGQPVVFFPQAPQSNSQNQPTNDNSALIQAISSGLSGFHPGGAGDGGDRPAGGGGGSSYPADASDGTVSSLALGKFAGTAGAESLRIVDGCASGKVQFKAVTSEGDLPQGCDKTVKMSETLSDLLDQHFHRCVDEAAGLGDNHDAAKIYDDGTMSDARHLAETTTSMHTLGLAIDIRAIQLGSKVWYAQKPSDDGFFEKFRECWGKVIVGFRGSCMSSEAHPGSVGNEDAEEKHHHLHISAPYCPEYAMQHHMKVACLMQRLFGELAFADTDIKASDGPPAKFKYQTVKLKDGGSVLLSYMDTGPEPATLGIRVSVSLKCKAQDKYTKLNAVPFEGCDFSPATFDAAKGLLTIHLKAARIDNKGDMYCDQKSEREVPIKCP